MIRSARRLGAPAILLRGGRLARDASGPRRSDCYVIRSAPHHSVMLALAALAAQQTGDDWWSRNATLIVGVVGIVVSGFVGPTITALWTARRERHKDQRALIVARRDDLRSILDETAALLGGAIGQLRPLLDAQLSGRPLPKEPVEFLSTLTPLGQRLRLRLAEDSAVVAAYDEAQAALVRLEAAATSQPAWDAGVEAFEAARSVFLEEGRRTVQAPVEHDEEF